MEARPLASGRDCEVFALPGGRVARAYTDGRPAGAEAEPQQSLFTLGYPVPRVEGWDGPRIVIARIDGPTLGVQLVSGAVPCRSTAPDGRAAWPDGQSVGVDAGRGRADRRVPRGWRP